MTNAVKPSGSALGAGITGADLRQTLEKAACARTPAAFYQHEVFYFRGQALSDQDRIRFSVRIVGLPEDESSDPIAEPAAHCVKPGFTYLHNWQQHDLAMWDDCFTRHEATFDYPASLPRLMHQATVVGAPTLQ